MNKLQKQLIQFWIDRVGAQEITTFDCQGAAATFHPRCFFGSLDKTTKPIIYTQPSWRFDDHTQGKSPVRFANHTQVQLLIPYYPAIITDYLDSLKHIGIDISNIQFVENNWRHKSLGALGVGWEVLINNLEIMQFTFFEYIGQQKLLYTPIELAYGLERLSFAINQPTKISGLRLAEEQETSQMVNENIYSTNDLDNSIEKTKKLIHLPTQAYRLLLECNKIFNLITLTYSDKNKYMDQISQLSTEIAINYRKKYVETV